MASRVAITTIRVRKPGATSSVTIKAGTLLNLEGEELASLESQDAVVEPGDMRAAKFGYGPNSQRRVGVVRSAVEKVEPKAAEPKVEPEAEVAAEATESFDFSDDQSDNVSSENFDDMTVKQVENYMAEQGIEKPADWARMNADAKREWIKAGPPVEDDNLEI